MGIVGGDATHLARLLMRLCDALEQHGPAAPRRIFRLRRPRLCGQRLPRPASALEDLAQRVSALVELSEVGS